jgi:hypothetical protein
VDEGIGGWWCEAVRVGLHPLDSSSDSVRKFALFGLWPHDSSSATVCMYKEGYWLVDVTNAVRLQSGALPSVPASKGILQLLASHPNSQRYTVTTVLRQAA